MVGKGRVKFLHWFKKLLSGYLMGLREYDISNNHYIFSDPRGGSTWLMDIIYAITKDPVIWEPLYLGKKDSPFNTLNFGWRQYIPEDAEWNEAKYLFDQLFTGKILTDRILFWRSLPYLLNSKSLLFKICRANAMLPWLVKNYHFKYKPIYLIRHPFAVASSQLRSDDWNYPFTHFKIPAIPFNEHFLKHKSFLETIETKEEALVADWCMANMVPLNHKHNNRAWLTLTYEQLVLHPEKSMNRVLSSWGINYDLSLIDFKKDSSTTEEDSPHSTIDRVSHWQDKLTDDQLNKMGRVLDYFNIEVYSKDDPLPKKVFN